MTNYTQAFRVKQALPKSDFNVSNYFPVIGTLVNLTNSSKDNNTNQWTLNSGASQSITSTNVNVSVTINGAGGNTQSLIVGNTVASGVEHKEIIYGLNVPVNVYHEISVASKVCRVGETNTITLTSIYNNPPSSVVRVEVIDANDDSLFYSQDNVTQPINIIFTYRGSFNIRVISTVNSVITENKQFRLITVTPALRPRANAYVYVLQSTTTIFNLNGGSANSLDGVTSNLSPGDTVVIKLPPEHTSESMYRLRLLNIKGTLQSPITITIDEPAPLIFNYTSFWGIIAQGCEHIILDGKGYQNIEYGLHLQKHPDSLTGTVGFQVTSLTNYVEAHSLEFSDAEFTQILCKTDPDVNNPATLRENFTMQNTLIHNNIMRDSRGEGIYLGYFDASVHVKKNSAGVDITYRAHNMNDTKIYRNIFLRCGWDGLQLNNATGKTEIHDNYIKDSAIFGEPDQNTGMSLTLEGKIFNNIIDGCSGIGIQAGALGPLDVYNNVITNIGQGAYAFYLLSSINVPEQFGNGAINTLPVKVFNNNLITNGNRSCVSAFNVCQYLGFRFNNNIVSTSNFFSGQTDATITEWVKNSSNNTILDMNDLNKYKFGSLPKSNFNLYPDSLLTSGGILIGDQYDSRGFKNWSNIDKFIGVNAGIIRLSNNILTLSSIKINNGNATTDLRNVLVTATFIGNPTSYLISESSSFVGATWSIYIDATIPFQISSTQGIKTVYLKLKNSSVETLSASSSITYSSNRQFLVNFTATAVYNNPANFNKFTAPGILLTSEIVVGSTLSNLIDTTLVASNLTLTVTDAFNGVDSNASASETYPYPYDVVRWNWIQNAGGKGSVNLSNCNNAKLYDIILYAHRGFNAVDQYFTVNNVNQVFNARHGTGTNYNNQIVFNNVVPVNGIITIDVKSISGTALIGVLDITEK
jgi:hypothetical protein